LRDARDCSRMLVRAGLDLRPSCLDEGGLAVCRPHRAEQRSAKRTSVSTAKDVDGRCGRRGRGRRQPVDEGCGDRHDDHEGADDYLTKPFELRELVLRLRALDRRRAHHRPPVREIAGLRLDAFRREVHRDGRYVALTRKQFAVLEVLVAAEGGVVSAEELLERAWDENADPFTNAVRITVSALRKRLGEPWIIATVTGVGYRIDAQPGEPV